MTFITNKQSSILDNLELVMLHEFSLILNSSHKIDQIIRSSAQAIRKMFRADGCHISLARTVRDDLQLATAIHDGIKSFPAGVDETKGITGLTFQTGQIVIVTDAEHDPRVTKRIYELLKHKSIVAVPIIVKDKIIGVIAVYSPVPSFYTNRDGEFLLMLGNHLGLAIEYAQLLLRVQRSAWIDPLTAAFNRGYLYDQLAPMLMLDPPQLTSLIMLDVNDLKVINDTFGHTTGDYALKQIALILKNNVREIDIVSRYGGDEFAIILPGADASEAVRVAERIEQAVATYPFEDKLQAFRVSVSWGSVTTSCHNTASIDAFIDAADRKLYNMKRHKP
ncbi:MAG TPA: sensor domain-containing diguanylate cyclase, partial [Desulfobacteria bacterium]|nr:sensor domain-containing diguanylate cyclase [Desulfobacteria bacterium]